jgi:hypothetical protein
MSAVICVSRVILEKMSNTAGSSYADVVKDQLQNPLHRRSMREVGRAIDYSYEHVRKVVAGQLTFTREFNDALRHELQLNPEEMWRLAQNERHRKRFDEADLPADIHKKDPRLREIWDALDPYARECWIRMGRDLCAVVERASRSVKGGR